MGKKDYLFEDPIIEISTFEDSEIFSIVLPHIHSIKELAKRGSLHRQIVNFFPIKIHSSSQTHMS